MLQRKKEANRLSHYDYKELSTVAEPLVTARKGEMSKTSSLSGFCRRIPILRVGDVN